MNTYAILLRGINVGGKNIIPMAKLRAALEAIGFENVASYIASGNLIVDSALSAAAAASTVERVLVEGFGLDPANAKTLVLIERELDAIVTKKPKGFGDEPSKYHNDAVFLIGVTPTDAIKVFSPRDGVDTVWPGPGVVYSQRLSAQRTKSRLNRIMASPLYKSMTIRNWNTTLKLLELLKSRS